MAESDSGHGNDGNSLISSVIVMPRAKSAKTLLELSIAHVVQSMDLWSWKPIELSDTSDSDLVQSPLHQLPLRVLKEIVHYLHVNKLLRKHLKWVITSQLNELLLTPHDEKEIHVQLKHASIQCPLLKKLKFENTWKNLDIETSIVQFLPRFQQLEVLEIAYTSVRDNSLEVFGTYFKHLRELDVSHCSGVTDNGIQRLCGSAHHLKGESRRKEYIWDYGKCKLIEKLCVMETSVTKKGIQIALQNLPSLKVLRHELVVEVLSNIHQLALESNMPVIPKYSLIEIAVVRTSPYAHGSFGLALTLCPSVIKVNIDGSLISRTFLNSDLLELLSLASLCHLQIYCPSYKVTFHDGLIPLLKANGNLLESLELEMFSDVDIHSIIELCPNLNSLLILFCNYREIPVEEKESSVRWKRIKIEQPFLRKLEVLRLNGFSPKFNAESLLLQLLSSPSLRIHEITGCVQLTDSILETVVLRHYFQNLEELELAYCNSLTIKGIDLFMNDNNSINSMDLKFYGEYSEFLTIENLYNEWEEKSKQKNWQFNLTYDFEEE